MIKINKSQLDSFFKAIAEKYPLYMPLKKAGQTNYGFYDGESEYDIETLKTVKSPKDAFFPQSENMMKFVVDGKKIDIQDVRKECVPFVMFGVRACDYKAFSVLDKVFLGDPVDTYYQAKREAGVIFTLACTKPEESCFCGNFGIDAAQPSGDAVCTLWGEYLYVEPVTEKAKKVLENVGFNAESADKSEIDQAVEQSKKISEKLPFAKLDLSRFKPENLNELFDSPAWEELSRACLGCGTCTFVCPTCQCFDIRDFKTDKDVLRFRCWDSCMYSDFTQMAAANPRTTQMQRYRQRFMHKLVYYPSQYGDYSCVGCGRCVNKCPQKLNIVKVIKKLGGETK